MACEGCKFAYLGRVTKYAYVDGEFVSEQVNMPPVCKATTVGGALELALKGTFEGPNPRMCNRYQAAESGSAWEHIRDINP